MEPRNLGRSGLVVPPLCLGTMTFGEPAKGTFMHEVAAPAEVGLEIMSRSLDRGLYFFDTADVYGDDGRTEKVVGQWLSAEKGRREKVILATKMRFRMHDGPLGTGASRRRVIEACEASLRRLKTDYIDLYQVHMQDMATPEEETLSALDDLVRQGKVRYIGCSNYAAYRLMQSLWISERRNLERFVSMQMQYSLVVRQIELEHVPVARDHGVGILPWGPLAGGFLTGKIAHHGKPPEGSRLAKWMWQMEQLDQERCWKVLGVLRDAADAIGATPSQVALAWCMRKPEVTSVIFGARTVEQYEDNAGALEVELPDELFTRLEQASAFPLPYPYDFLETVNKTW